MNERPHLDEEALAELRDVMEDEFDILIRTYINDSSERLEALRHAMACGDQDAFAKTAHSFKGSSMNIGAARLGELCMQAEQAGKDCQLEQAASLLPGLEAEFEMVRAMMEDSLLA